MKKIGMFSCLMVMVTTVAFLDASRGGKNRGYWRKSRARSPQLPGLEHKLATLRRALENYTCFVDQLGKRIFNPKGSEVDDRVDVKKVGYLTTDLIKACKPLLNYKNFTMEKKDVTVIEESFKIIYEYTPQVIEDDFYKFVFKHIKPKIES